MLTAKVNGVNYTYSTSPGVPYAPFVPSLTPGSIQTQFGIGEDGNLAWWNPGFATGEAQFCAMGNGTVYAVFNAASQPEGCAFVSLALFSASSCQGLQLSTITGPTGRE